MAFTEKDVGFRYVLNERLPLSEAERQTIAEEWNENELAQAELRAVEEARAVRREELKLEAAADAFIDRLRGATPQQIKDYMQANVTDLASARFFMAKLACAVAYALSGGADK